MRPRNPGGIPDTGPILDPVEGAAAVTVEVLHAAAVGVRRGCLEPASNRGRGALRRAIGVGRGQDARCGFLFTDRLATHLGGGLSQVGRDPAVLGEAGAELRHGTRDIVNGLAVAIRRTGRTVVRTLGKPGRAGRVGRCVGPLVALVHVRRRVGEADVAVAVIAGGLLDGGCLGRVLRRVEHRHRLTRNAHGPA